MSCCGGREGREKIYDTQKWDYINLSDFRTRGCVTPMSYVLLWILLFVSIACYIIDLFTAVQLVLFDRWSGKIEPALPLQYSRWIFLGCIIASYIFLGYRWWKAIKAIKSGGIAQSYLDPLAVRLQSMRMGKNGRGWRRFLVFAEMTRGKKGADTVALFTFFSFEAWYRIIFAEGPRNVINAMTIVSVFQANLIPNGQQNQSESGIQQFFDNVKVLADGDYIRAAVLFGMIFVVITWTIAAISLISSCFFYIFFLWNHVAYTDKNLRAFCKRRIDQRLSKVVDEKVDKGLARADKKRARLDMKAGVSTENIADIRKAPTLPNLGPDTGDMLPAMPLARQNSSGTTMSPYGSEPGSAMMPPPPLGRMNTNLSDSSFRSYGSNAPLINDASPMGSGPPPRSFSPAPGGGPPRAYSPAPGYGPPRSFSPAPGYGPPRSFSPAPGMGPQRSFSPAPGPGGAPPRSFSPAPLSSIGAERSMPPRGFTPGGRPPYQPGMPPNGPSRQNTQGSEHLISPAGSSNYGPPMPPMGGPGPLARQGTGLSNYSSQGRSSPGPGFRPPPPQQPIQEFEMRSQPPARAATASPFQAYNPSIKSPTRNFTAPQGRPMPPPTRSFTSPLNGGPPPGGSYRGAPGPPGPPGHGPAPGSVYDESIYDHY